jgi:hypothetical protein
MRFFPKTTLGALSLDPARRFASATGRRIMLDSKVEGGDDAVQTVCRFVMLNAAMAGARLLHQFPTTARINRSR